MTPTSQKKAYLIDTSFLLAYQNRDDKQLMDDCRTTIDILKEEEYPRFIITDLIFCEYSSYIWHALRKNRKLTVERIEEVIENFEIEFIDSSIFKASYDLFLQRNKEGLAWSLVDCSSFIFMRVLSFSNQWTRRAYS